MPDSPEIQSLIAALHAAAEPVQRYRKEHGGKVSPELFEALMQVQGTYFTVELFVEVEGRGYAFRKRGKDEPYWQGQYHLPGTIFTPNDDDASILKRLGEDAGISEDIMQRTRLLPGLMLNDQYVRPARCISMQYKVTVDSVDSFDGDWKVFSLPDIEALSTEYEKGGKDLDIIDHHVAMTLYHESDEKALMPNLADYYPYLPRVYS